MGGAWECMIGIIKRVFRGVLNPKCRLTDENLETVFCEVECIINNRPLTKPSDAIEDCLPLTPNHLLSIKGDVTVPKENFNLRDVYRKRWKYVHNITNQFWKRCLKEYVPSLQSRVKWKQTKRNITVGDLVLIVLRPLRTS